MVFLRIFSTLQWCESSQKPNLEFWIFIFSWISACREPCPNPSQQQWAPPPSHAIERVVNGTYATVYCVTTGILSQRSVLNTSYVLIFEFEAEFHVAHVGPKLLCSWRWIWTPDSPTSASQVLRLQMYTIMLSLNSILTYNIFNLPQMYVCPHC